MHQLVQSRQNLLRYGLVMTKMPPKILRISKVRGRELRIVHLLRTVPNFKETQVNVRLALIPLREFRSQVGYKIIEGVTEDIV